MDGYVYAAINADVSPTVTLRFGDIYSTTHSLVRAHPEWFSDDWGAIARTDGPRIEDATAEPGVRNASRPTRTSA